jgi:hypothetical protein
VNRDIDGDGETRVLPGGSSRCFFPSRLRTKEVLLRKPKLQLHFESWMAIEKVVVVSDPLKASAGPYREM